MIDVRSRKVRAKKMRVQSRGPVVELAFARVSSEINHWIGVSVISVTAKDANGLVDRPL